MTEFTGWGVWFTVLLLWISTKLTKQSRRMRTMSAAIDQLVAEVAEIKTVEASEAALLDKLFGLLQAAVDTGDIAKVQSAITDLQAVKADAVAAIARNTPAEPPTP